MEKTRGEHQRFRRANHAVRLDGMMQSTGDYRTHTYSYFGLAEFNICC